MQPTPPKSIRTIGLVLACIGGFLFLSNGLSVLLLGVFDFPGRFLRSMPADVELPFDIEGFIRAVIPLAALSSGLGLLLGLGGLYMRQYRRWALLLVNTVVLAYIALLWYLPTYLRPLMNEFAKGIRQLEHGTPLPRFDALAQVGQYFNALFWSAPLAVALYLLNQKKTRSYFK